MSDNSVPHVSYGVDSGGRIVRIEAGANRSNVHRLPSIEETLRRLSTNFIPERQSSESNNGKNDARLKKIGALHTGQMNALY